MIGVTWILSAGFGGLVALGVPFAFAIGLVVLACLLLADIDLILLSQSFCGRDPVVLLVGDPILHAGRRTHDCRRPVRAPGARG
jgi:hypothetical protein